MIRKYKIGFINEYDEVYYTRCLSSINYLDLLRNNYNTRYDNNGKFNSSINAFKESLDHYVLMKMESEPNFINQSICDNYFNYLRKLSNSNRYDFYTNVVLFNVLNNPKFSRYKEKYGLKNQTVETKFGKAMVDINKIITKVRHDKTVTQDELNLLCGFVSDYRENTEILEEVVKYIFNNLTRGDSNLRCSLQVASAIATYLPYKCGVIKKNGFNPSDIRIFIADRHHYYENKTVHDVEYLGMGQSSGKYKQVILPAKIVRNTNFKSIVSSENPFSFKEYFKTKDYSFTLMLLTLYHEVTHQYQGYMSRKKISGAFIDKDSYRAGLPLALCDLLNYEYKDYDTNHDNDDIEIHATQVGWELCFDFYKDILQSGSLKNELLPRCTRNRNGTQSRYGFTVKQDKNGNLYDGVKYTLDKCSLIMKDAKKREKYLKEIPCLQYIFTDDGRFKIDILLLKNFGNTHIGAGLLEKLVNAPGIDSKISNLIKQNNIVSRDTINTMADNIYMGIKFSVNRIYMIEYYTRHAFNDSFQINKKFINVVNDILGEQANAIINGKRILHEVLKCHDYDKLIDSERKMTLEYYKKILDNIDRRNKLYNKGRK